MLVLQPWLVLLQLVLLRLRLRLRLGLAYALWALCALAYQHSLSVESVEIHLPSLPELPPHCHTTNGLPVHLNSTLQKAFKMASPSFSNIFDTLSPDLIYDYNLPWAPTIASSYNIPAVDFIPIGATMMSFSLHKLMKSSVEFPFQAIQFGGFHEMQFHNSMIKTAANKAKNKECAIDTMKRKKKQRSNSTHCRRSTQIELAATWKGGQPTW
ncbi:hypothetical protein CsSME_00002090 [Camellia sinensis var. sinensis]